MTCACCGGKGYLGGDRWLRPGPEAESSLLGRWPSTAQGVWSDALWQAALACPVVFPTVPTVLPCIGCDVARFGDDYSSFHVRWGNVSLHHESHNGWGEDQTAGHLKLLAREWCAWIDERMFKVARFAPLDPKAIPINIDDSPVGGGVIDMADGFNFRGVGAGTTAQDQERYPNTRSELWFVGRERARSGLLALSLLDKRSLMRLQQQLLAPKWKMNGKGQRVVEPKEVTKEKLGYSPDDADGLNLCYYEGGFESPERIDGPNKGMDARKPIDKTLKGRDGLYNRRRA